MRKVGPKKKKHKRKPTERGPKKNKEEKKESLYFYII